MRLGRGIGMDAPQATPARQPLDDLELMLAGKPGQRVAVGRMQPFAAEIDRHPCGGCDGDGTPADALARLEHDDAEPALDEAPRRGDASGAGADDGNVAVAAHEGRGSICPGAPVMTAAAGG